MKREYKKNKLFVHNVYALIAVNFNKRQWDALTGGPLNSQSYT